MSMALGAFQKLATRSSQLVLNIPIFALSCISSLCYTISFSGWYGVCVAYLLDDWIRMTTVCEKSRFKRCDSWHLFGVPSLNSK